MTQLGSVLPGRSTPGPRTAGFSTPGARTPASVVESATSGVVPVDAAGVSDLDGIGGGRVVVESVTVVAPDVFGFDFNVTVDGDELFAAAQSPETDATETFGCR